jgi:GNAT superfamily N-acetyltransferase
LDTDTFNIVCAARLQPDGVEEMVRRVVDHFASASRPFSWWVAPGDLPGDLGPRLEKLGLPAAESAVAMSAALDSGFDPGRWRKPWLRIERVTSPEQLAVFARINAENWDPPDTVVEAYYRRGATELVSAASPQRFFLASIGEQHVAAVETTLAAGVVGIYNLSTRAAHRNLGIGAAVLAGALADARSAGYGTAVLQAAPATPGLYGRLGFSDFGLIREHKPADL